MKTEPLIFAGVCDWAGIVRGKAFPEAELETRLRKGVGLATTNIMMSCFGPVLTTPFGTTGDQIIRPDPATRVEVPFEDGARAADAAVMLREMARAVAWRLGQRAIFAPMLTADGIGNGTHIHLSLWDGDTPVTHDPSTPLGISARVAAFFAGIVAHLPAITAFTAPSVASYYRLTPNRWAPVTANIARQDRGAAVRVAPIFETSPEEPTRQFNVEYRVADASACPYLALGAVVWAGVDGLTRKLP